MKKPDGKYAVIGASEIGYFCMVYRIEDDVEDILDTRTGFNTENDVLDYVIGCSHVDIMNVDYYKGE